MFADFLLSEGFWFYGGIFVALCLILKLIDYLTGDIPEWCETVLGIYLLLVSLLVWGVYSFGIALAFAALMLLCLGLIMLIGNGKKATGTNTKGSQQSYRIVPRNFDTTSLKQMLQRVEYERQWSAVTFADDGFANIYRVNETYKRRILEMYDAVLRFGDKMAVCQSSDNAANVASMVYESDNERIVYSSLSWRKYGDGTIYQVSVIVDGPITLTTAIPDNDHDYKCWWEYEHKGVLHYLINCDGIEIK